MPRATSPRKARELAPRPGYDNQNQMVWAKDSASDGGTVTTLATYVYDALGKPPAPKEW